FRPGEMRGGVFGLELFKRGAAPDHDLGSRQIEIEEAFDILLDRNPSDIGEDRLRQVLEQPTVYAAPARVGELDIDAAAPQRSVSEAVDLEHFLHGRRRHHDPTRLVMECMHEAIAGPERNPVKPRRDIFRKLGVIARREWEFVFEAYRARIPPER